MSKILLDTNVLIYSIDEGSKYFKKSQNIFSEQLELYTTSKNLSEFLAVITRIPKNPLSLNDALLVVGDFINIMTILYPTRNLFPYSKKFYKSIKRLDCKYMIMKY